MSTPPAADDIAGIQYLYGTRTPNNNPVGNVPAKPVTTNFITYSGDFNGDGKQDILWRNSQTGEVDIWFMNGPSVISKNYVATVGLDWKIAGIGDFNGDGTSDILWQNIVDGSFVIWIMQGTSYSGYAFPAQGNEWSITAVADLYHTGRASIVWRNVVTGDIIAWQGDAQLNFSGSYIGSAGLDWKIVGAADIFGNGSPALIWRSQTNGQVIAWLLNGTQANLGNIDLS